MTSGSLRSSTLVPSSPSRTSGDSLARWLQKSTTSWWREVARNSLFSATVRKGSSLAFANGEQMADRDSSRRSLVVDIFTFVLEHESGEETAPARGNVITHDIFSIRGRK